MPAEAWPPWPRNNQKNLAKYASADAAHAAMPSGFFPLGAASSHDLRTQGRLQEIVQSIYDKLCALGIDYDLEPLRLEDPANTKQAIRSPAEVVRDKRGTCIDLALLFAALCLGERLLPMVVLLGGGGAGSNHALVVVDLKYTADQWREPRFLETAYRTEGLIPGKAGGAFIRGRLQAKQYMAVECTGFAGRPTPHLTFDDACANGAEKIETREHIVTVDIAALQGKGETPYGRDIIVQFGLGGTPASFRGRVQKFLSYYLGSEKRPVPFGGRGPQFEQLDAWLANPSAPPNFLITAPAGGGKTALLVHWLQRIDAAAWPVAFVPISIRFETNRPEIFYQALAARLAEILGEPLEKAVGDAAAVYKDKVIEQLDSFAKAGKRCLLAIDGLDEATGWRVDTSVLPTEPIPGLRVITGARVLAGDSGPEDWLRRLDWRPGDACTLEVPPLDRDGIADVLREMDVPVAGVFGNVDLLGELERITEGDPLLLRFYIEDLRERATSLQPEDLAGREKGLGPYFKNWLDKQGGIYRAGGAAFDEQTIKAILVLLACAIGPLRLADLVHLVRRLLGSDRIISEDSLEPIQRFLIGGPHEGGYVLGHPKLGDYLREGFFGGSEDVARARDAILAWGSDTVRRLNAGELEPDEAPPYLLQFYAQHLNLKESNAGPDQFRELVEDGWRRAWEAYQGGFEGFASDVRNVWQRLKNEAAGDPDRLKAPRVGLGGQIRCMLCLSSIRSIGMNVLPALLVDSVRYRVLSAKQAVYLAKLGQPEQQVGALIALTRWLPDTQRLAVLHDAVAAACSIGNEWQRAEALAAVAELLSPELLADAFAAARTIGDDWSRANALGGVAGRLPPGLLAEALEDALAIGHDWGRALALAVLAERLPPEVLGEALAAARAIGDVGGRAHALIAMAKRLSPKEQPGVLAEALAAARAVGDGYGRARALSAVAECLPPKEQSGVLGEVLAAARAIEDDRAWVRSDRLTDVAERLPAEERPAILAEALAAARAAARDTGSWHGACALAAVAERLPPGERPAVLAEALAAARAVGDDRSRANAIAGVAKSLPQELLSEALAAARAIGEDEVRARTLADVAERLPPEERPRVLAEALAAARAVGDDRSRAHALTAVAGRLEPDDRPAVLAEAVAAARAIKDGARRARFLAAVADRLPPELLGDALAAACSVENEWQRAEVLAALADRLPSGLLAEALAAAQAIGDKGGRALALAGVARRLPPEQQPGVLAEALAAARTIRDDGSRAHVLSAMAERLQPKEQTAVLAEALVAARAIGDERIRGVALAVMAARLPAELLGEVLAVARAIKDDESRGHALFWVAERLPPEFLGECLADARSIGDEWHGARFLAAVADRLPPELLGEALAAARAIGDEWCRAVALAAVADRLPSGLLTEALAAAQAIGDKGGRALALAGVARRLPPEQQPGVLAEALAAARTIGDDGSRAHVLSAMAERLQPKEQTAVLAEALVAARAIGDEGSRADFLAALAEHLPPELFREALAAARAIGNDGIRARALAGLALHVTGQERMVVLEETIEGLAALPRPSSLELLERLAPMLAEVGGSELIREAARTVRDVGGWWP
jgi:hypothetical protein